MIKIRTTQLFARGRDIRKHLKVDIPDDVKEFLINELGIDHADIETVLRHADIFVNFNTLPDTIEVWEEDNAKN